jgi:class 3 adenylate cyclase
MLDRYLGAVIFADVSGFSNLGDALERREHEERAAGTQQIVPGAPTASEELARILGKEVEKMVEDVTRGGGDVIKFAGDCVIAVFPAEQYMDLPQTGKYGSLALATGQAVRVSVQMMQAKNLFLFKSQQRQQEFSDEIAALVSKLNIHIAIGAGEVYGYHVGGVGGKWDYLISGPVMEQVRSADHDSGAGEVVLSKEAYARLKTIKMRKTFLESGNVKLETYFGPNEEPPFTRPWEKIQDQPHLCEALAANLQSYVPSPLVHQVESGNTLWLAGEKQISTIFCRLIGIDYEAQQGAKAVTQLAEIITQVQAILASQEGTLTRVISDDKGTSMLMAFDHPQHAVDAAMTITTAVENIPVPDGAERFRTAIGITTGVVFCGPVGGRIRAEYTMHGSVVNFSARLMTCPLIKNSGGILCDLATTKLAVRTEFVAQAPRHFKGFEKDVVSFMPTRRKTSVKMPVTDITDVSIELETDIDTASDVLSGDTHTVRASVDWEKTFQSTLSSSPRRNCVAVVETDVSGHWCMHEIQEAVKLYVPTMTLSNMCFNDQDQEHNRTQLQRFAQVASAADSVVVLQKADALDDANWQLLWNLCCTMIVGLNNADEPVSVVPGVAKTGGILVITIDPFHRDVSVAHPYNQLVSSSGIIYEKLHAVVTKDTGSHLGVPEEITLEVAAVVSAGTVDDEKSSLPCFCVDLIVAAHPYVRARSWTEATVYRHVETLCDAGSIRRRESSGGGHDVCEFQSHELHIQCYRRVLNEQRMPIHTAAVAWLEKRLPSLQTSPQASAIELYRQLRFHCLCIGENERAEVFGSMSSQDGGQKSSRRRLGPSHESLYVVTRWQNERRFASHYSGVNLLPDDPAAWCDQVYSESTRDDAVLPTGDATHRWEWVSDWVVKIESRYHPSDEDGWRYCYGFSKSVGDGPSWSEHQTATRLVRARQWFRVALRLPIGRTRHGTLSAAEARMFISQAGVEQTQQSDQPSIASPPSGGSQGAGDGRERTLREKVEFLESENGALQDAVAHLQAEALRLQAAGTTVHSTAAKEMWGVFSKRVVRPPRCRNDHDRILWVD